MTLSETERYLLLSHRLKRAARQAEIMYQNLWESSGRGDHSVQADKVVGSVEQAVEALADCTS